MKRFMRKKNDDKTLHSYEIVEILEADNQFKLVTNDQTKFKLKDVLDHYESYQDETMEEKHGLTAKFTLTYVNLVELYELHERAIRTSDLDMYIYAAYRMCALFFTFSELRQMAYKEFGRLDEY